MYSVLPFASVTAFSHETMTESPLLMRVSDTRTRDKDRLLAPPCPPNSCEMVGVPDDMVSVPDEMVAVKSNEMMAVTDICIRMAPVERISTPETPPPGVPALISVYLALVTRECRGV